MAFHAHKCDIVGHGLTGNCNQSGWRRGQIGLYAGRKTERHQQLAATGSAQVLATGVGLQVQETDCRSAKSGVRCLGHWLGWINYPLEKRHTPACQMFLSGVIFGVQKCESLSAKNCVLTCSNAMILLVLIAVQRRLLWFFK